MPRHATMNNFINSQVRQWQARKEKIELSEAQQTPLAPFITISREYGSGGFEIGAKIAEILNAENGSGKIWAAYDRELINGVMDDTGLSSTLTHTLTSNARKNMTNLIQTSFSKFPPQVSVYLKLVETIRIMAVNGNVILVGRASNVITRDLKRGSHIRITAPLEWRIKRISDLMKLSRKDAEKLIIEKNKERDRFVKEYIKFDPEDPLNYDFCLNNTKFSTEEAARLIIAGMKIKGLL